MSLKIISPGTVYLGSAEGGSGGGSAKQVTLLSVTTAPSGTFEKGSQYYNSTNRVIYTAVDDNTWTGATISTPEFGVIYIYSNNGVTTYYQWDGDNLVETDLEKYQLIANKSDDFTESSKNKYPSSYALYKGLGSVRPVAVTNSGATLPATTGYNLGDTFLNTTDKKLYTTKADSYEWNTNVYHGGYLTIDFETGIATNIGIGQQQDKSLARTLSSENLWTGNKTYQIKFKPLVLSNQQFGLFTITNDSPAPFVCFGIDTDNKIKYCEGSTSYGRASVNKKIDVLNTVLQTNKEYTLIINKLGSSCEVSLLEYGIEIENNSFEVSTSFSSTVNRIEMGLSYFESGYYKYKNMFNYAEVYLLETSWDFLKASGTLVWNSGESLIDLAQYADTTNGIMYFYANNQLFGDMSKYKLKATTTTIDTASVTVSEIKANTNYVFSNNAITDITLSGCETSFEETTIEFTTGSTAPLVTDNSSITWMDNFDITNLSANKSYLIVIFNKLGFVKEY